MPHGRSAGYYAAVSKAIIWDFNGTIISDVDLSVEGLNLLRARRQMDSVSVEQYRARFGFPIQDYYRGIGFDVSDAEYTVLSTEYHDHYFAHMRRCPPHAGITELIAHLAARGVRQAVLSAMYEQELRAALHSLQLDHCFEAIYGLGDLFARSKVERGRQLVAALGLQAAAEILLIGDTDHDIEVAHALGVQPISLTIGHQAGHRFAAHPNPQFETVADLRAALDRWIAGAPIGSATTKEEPCIACS